MRKILIFAADYLPHIGGAEIAIHEITSRLGGGDFDIVVPKLEASLPDREKIGNISVFRLGFGSKIDKFAFPLLGAIFGLKMHRNAKYSVIWAMMASWGGLAAAFFKIAKPKTPFILTLQEGDEEDYLKRYVFGSEILYKIFIRPCYRFIFRKADYMTAISQYLIQRGRNAGFSGKIDLIPNGVQYDKFAEADFNKSLREKLGFKDTDFVIISVSRLEEKNGIEYIIESLKSLPPNHKVLLLGKGSLRDVLEKKAKQANVHERVIFLGNISNDDVPKYLKISDVFVRPSLSEGMGISFLEAMASGIPVIATRVGGIADFLFDHKTGLVVEVKNANDIAKKILEISTDKKLSQKIVTEASIMVKEKYSWEKISSLMNESFAFASRGLPLRITIATGIYPPQIGGPAQYAYELERAFKIEGTKTFVVTYGKEREFPTGIRHAFFFLKCLKAVIKSDAVFILDTFSAGLPALIASKLIGRKSVLRTGGDFLWESYVERTKKKVLLKNFYNDEKNNFNFKEKVVFRVVKFVLSNVDLLVFSTSWQLEIFKKPYGINSERTAVVENYYGPREIMAPVKNNIFVGATRKLVWKNLDVLERVFKELKDQGVDVFLDLENTDYERNLDKIRNARAVVLVSLGDISPNLILDSIRMGKPFILTSENGINDRVKDLGIIVNPFDLEAIKAAVIELMDDLKYEKYVRAIKNFTFYHSWGEMAKTYIKYLST